MCPELEQQAQDQGPELEEEVDLDVKAAEEQGQARVLVWGSQ